MIQSADNVEQRCLAAAGLTENRDKFILPEFKVNTLERVDDRVPRHIVFFDVFELEHCFLLLRQ